MVKENAVVDINAELEELPGLIAYQEQLVEDCLMEIDEAKNNKNKRLSEVMMTYADAKYVVLKAKTKEIQAEEDSKILVLKRKYSTLMVEFNRLKNRFQSIRKLASLRIEEMKHGMEGGVSK